MENFDDKWNEDIDITDINIDPTISTNIKNSIKPDNEDMATDWLSADEKISWKDYIAGIEKHLTKKYGKLKDKWNYQKDNLLSQLQTAKKTNNTKEITSLKSQLVDLKLQYFELKQKAEEDEESLNFDKGRALGIINNVDTYLHYGENPKQLKKELDTGKYDYASTKLW